MTVQEISSRWGVHYNTVAKLIRNGDMRAEALEAKGFMYWMKEVRYEKAHGMPPFDGITAEAGMVISQLLLKEYVSLGLLKGREGLQDPAGCIL